MPEPGEDDDRFPSERGGNTRDERGERTHEGVTDEAHGGSESRLRSVVRVAAGGRLTRRSAARSLVFFLLAVSLTLAPFAYITGAAMVGAPPDAKAVPAQPSCVTADTPDGGTAPRLGATVERGEGRRTIRVTYDTAALRESSDTKRFTVSVRGMRATVENTSGFRRESPQFVWDGSSHPSLTYRFEVSDGTSGALDGFAEYGASDAWALGPLPAVTYSNVEYTVRPDGLTPAEDTRANLVYVGELSTVSRSLGCQNVSVAYPPGFDREEATDIAATFDAASDGYPLGTRSRHVSALVAPWDMSVGGYTIDDFVALNPDGNISVETIAVHEYVHTRQRNRYTPQMRWLVEAIPSYYMFRIRERTGGLSVPDYALNLYAFHERAEWDRPFDSQASPNHYYRGAVTLAALDQRIRERTDGRRSLLDVVARLNDVDGEIGFEEFERATAAVAGQSFADWLDRHVTRGVPVAIATPDGGTLPRTGWYLLRVYHLLLARFPPFALAFVVLWYALVGSLYEASARLWR